MGQMSHFHTRVRNAKRLHFSMLAAFSYREYFNEGVQATYATINDTPLPRMWGQTSSNSYRVWFSLISFPRVSNGTKS